VPGIEISAPIIWGKVQTIAGSPHWSTTLWGNDYLAARRWPLKTGRGFSPEEIASGAKVAIIGQVIADKLLNGEPRVGETMRINSVPFTIIGILRDDRCGKRSA
jgi:putative ABC transport system permease protein